MTTSQTQKEGDIQPQLDALLAAIHSLESNNLEQWSASLADRKQHEMSFSDSGKRVPHTTVDADTIDHKPGRRSTGAAPASTQYIIHWLDEHAPGHVVLDYGCGSGRLACAAASAGAALAIGLDISRARIEDARLQAQEQGLVERTTFVQSDCENTGLPSESVDVVVCRGVLHHLELPSALGELRRIMRPDGTALIQEPLACNPLFQWYRRLTPGDRTDFEAEHIFSLRDIRQVSSFFEVKSVTYWHLLSLGAALLRRTPLYPSALTIANVLDRFLLQVCPFRYLAWTVMIELVKPAESTARESA